MKASPRFLLLVLLFAVTFVVRAETFTVTDIRVDGLQRVSAGTLFASFPINVGDSVDSTRLAEAIRSLFRTGLFTDIRLGRDSNVLVIRVAERPSISKIEIDGNKAIETDQLKDGLKSAGIEEGQVFKRSTLDRLELEILRSYVGQGRYSAKVTAKVEEEDRNRVSIKLDIKEGEIASIKHINIVGNKAFTDEELANQMELKVTGFWSFIMADDKYAREKLSGDLEKVRSYYLNRGYIDFTIDSTQVSISPDRKEVFITASVTEGPEYTVRDVSLKGELILPEEDLRKLVLMEPGETFSREKMTTTADLLSKRLGAEGYTFASVNGVPETHPDNTASITFYIEPGRRAYVRRVNFRGNVNTRDDVLRQEMRQMEGGVASTDLIEGSKTRLERLGYFKDVTVETPAVPGVSDQIDVNYSVEEQPTGSLSASLGFSQESGVILGLNVAENNFFGTGKRGTFSINRSDAVKLARVSYMNPYYTVDGVSRGFSVFARETDFEEENSADYIQDRFGGSMNFGYPTDNITRINFGVGYNHDTLRVGDEPTFEVLKFIRENGDVYSTVFAELSWTRNSLNRGVLPTKGYSNSIAGNVTMPFSDLTYYKVDHRYRYFLPIDKLQQWVVYLHSDLGYGGAYGSLSTLPFYENFFAGGFGSVRGYEPNSIGPQTTPAFTDQNDPDAAGGNILIQGSAELIVPTPFVNDDKSMRSSLFIDSGSAFDTYRDYDPSLSLMRMSFGFQFSWITAIGPISFSLAKPFHKQPGDDTQMFQFSLGQTF